MSKLPSNWQVKFLGEICEIIGGNPAPKGDDAFTSNGLPFVKMKDVGRYHLTNNLIDIENRVSSETVKKNRLKLIKRGSILLPRSGSVALNHRAILGTDAYMVSHLCALEIKDLASVYNQFLYYYLTTINFSNITKKTTGLDALTFEDLARVKIPLPPLPIQKQIAEILEQADKAKQKRKEANKLTDEFLQSVFIEMFGDPVKNPKGWDSGIINDVLEYSEYGTSNKSNQDDLGYPILGMSNITYDGQLDLTKLSFVELTDDEFNKLKLEQGDIIFNRTNSTELVGKTTYWNKNIDAVLASYLVKLRLNNKFNPIVFSFLLNTTHFKTMFIRRCKKAVGQSNISPTLLKEFPIYFPTLSLQQQFAEIVNKTEALKEKQKLTEQELENLFQSLMQKAFKGELVS